MNNAPSKPGLSRRSFLSTTALGTAGTAIAARSLLAAAAPNPSPAAAPSANTTAAINYAKSLVAMYGKPNSRYNGVLIGTITYSFRSMPSSAEQILKYCLASGISGIELMGGPADSYLSGAAGGRGGLPGATPAQVDAYVGMTQSLAPLVTAAQTARTKLTTASLLAPTDRAAMQAAIEELRKAEYSLAQARVEELAKIQGSNNKLNEEQLAVVYQANGGPAAARGGRGGGGGGGAATPLPAWMTPQNLVKLGDLRKMYDEAGVSIYGLKNVGGGQSDAELDYRFEMAKILGASHVTLELANAETTERLGAFGAKHKVMVGYHTHAQARIDSFDVALKQSAYNAINVDAGHYMAGNGFSVLPLLRKYPDRVGSIHLKDRQTPANGRGNLMWGLGDTDIKDIVCAIRDEKWKFPASAELEYNVPFGSNAVIEVARCRTYAAWALTT